MLVKCEQAHRIHPMNPILVTPNTRVEIELVAKDKTREKLILALVPDAAANFEKGLLGIGTPLAQTLLGHAANETLEYKRGDIVQVKILSVQANVQAPTTSADERAETLRRARDKAELANMVSFALTFDSKWGDYNLDMFDVTTDQEHVADPKQIVEQHEPPQAAEQTPNDSTEPKERAE